MPASTQIGPITVVKTRLQPIIPGLPIEQGVSIAASDQTNATTDAAGNVVAINDQSNGALHEITTPADAEGQLIAGSVDASGYPSLDFVYLGRWRSGGSVNGVSPSTVMPYVLSVTTDRYGSALGGLSNVWLSYNLNSAQQYISAQRLDGTTEHDVGRLTMGALAVNPTSADVRLDATLNMDPYAANPGGDFTLTGRGNMAYSNTQFEGNLTVTCGLAANCVQPGPTESPAGYWTGNLAGDYADRATLAFYFRHQEIGDVAGAAIFDRGNDLDYSSYLPSRITGLSYASTKLATTVNGPQVFVSGTDGSDPYFAATAETDMGQKIIGVIYPGGDERDEAMSVNAPIPDHSDVEGRVISSTDYFAYLGRWRAGGTNSPVGVGPATFEAMPFVVGDATSLANAKSQAQDPLAYPQVLNYSLVDSTAQYLSAVRPDGFVDHTAGQVTSATLSVNPHDSVTSVNVGLKMTAYGARADTTLNPSGYMNLDANATSFSGTIQAYDGGPIYGNASGMLLGPQADKAGLSIGLNHADFGAIGASAILDRGANTPP